MIAYDGAKENRAIAVAVGSFPLDLDHVWSDARDADRRWELTLAVFNGSETGPVDHGASFRHCNRDVIGLGC